MRIDLNFASREYVLLRKVYAVLGAAILACVVLFAGFYHMHRRDLKNVDVLNARVAAQEAVLAKHEKELGKYARTVDKAMRSSTYTEAGFANAAIKRRAFSWTLFLGRLEELVPKGVGITGIRPDFKTLDVNISGTARDMETLTNFLDMLTRSEHFSDVPPTFKTSEENLGPEIGKVVQRFNFKIRYIPDPGNPGQAGTEEEGG